MRKDEIILREAADALKANANIEATYALMDFPYDGRLDAQINIIFDGGILTFAADVKTEIRNYHLKDLPNNKDLPLMFVADKLYPNVKEELRRMKVNYLDTAGNIFIHHLQNYIWLEGNRKTNTEKQTVNRAFTKQGLKVVFLFLWQKDMVNAPYRKIAELTGVALGNITLIMEGLRDAGFLLALNEKQYVLIKKKALLDRWIEGYRDVLKPTLHLGNFRSIQAETFKGNLLAGNINGAVIGGEPAAQKITQYLNAQIYTVYTQMKHKNFMIENRLIPDINGDIQVYEKFWADPLVTNFEVKTAPDLLVYADLIITDEPRCLETADIIFNKRLRYEFE